MRSSVSKAVKTITRALDPLWRARLDACDAVLACDLGDRAALFRCADAAPHAFGAPDIVVNCAGINIRKPMLELTADDWDRTMRLNLDAPFFLSQPPLAGWLRTNYHEIQPFIDGFSAWERNGR